MTRVRTLAVVLAVGALGLTACGAPTAGTSLGEIAPAAAPAAAPVASVASTKCQDGANQVASFKPDADSGSVSSLRDSPTYDRIRRVGRLVVGTSADVELWGARDPRTGQLEGFDIDMLKEIAKALDVPISYKVITYANRLPYLNDGSVDIVAHTMTINCNRWQGTGGQPNAINFSTEYYRAGQRVLVASNSPARQIRDLKGQKVCVPAGSTNVDAVQNMGLDLVEQDVIGDCLVLFQEGQVQAITGDDTVLAGFKAQDPYAKIIGPQFTQEPYGLGINKNDVPFTKFVNAVLENLRRDGRLAQIYRDTMGKAVPGAAPAVPQPVYGRNVDALGRS
jgi:polar amino acid transport system substrate-binding protein